MFNGKYNTASKRLGFLIGNNVHLTSLIAIGRLNSNPAKGSYMNPARPLVNNFP